jgi:hypothetical protein
MAVEQQLPQVLEQRVQGLLLHLEEPQLDLSPELCWNWTMHLVSWTAVL